MSAQVYSVSSQTEGTRKAFLEWKTISYINVVIILFLLVRIRNILTIFKISECPGIFSPWQMKDARREASLQDYPQEQLVVIRDEKLFPFVKFEIILPLLWFLLDPFTNHQCSTWSYIINMGIDSRTYQK